MANEFIHRLDESGFIIAWRYKYDFKSGKYEDPVMTYGEAKKRIEELHKEHPDMTFWAEKAKGDLGNRFYKPEAH